MKTVYIIAAIILGAALYEYAYPAMIATIVFMYNKTVFRELGMAYPPRRIHG